MEGSTYAVTFRLADSLPKHVLEAMLLERDVLLKSARKNADGLSGTDEARLELLHVEKIEKYLDTGHGQCWLKDDQIALIVADALKHFDGDRYILLAWCVMPNHVHVIVRPYKENHLSNILHSWKSFTAKEANRILQRNGEFWQEEYYDHVIRDQDDFCHAVEYVLGNPVQAGLKSWKWIGHIPW
jgi:REP element-mobilizing transposase RayT